MTEQRAIELLEYIRECGNGESPYYGCAQNIAISEAIKALEKQIPKTPFIWEEKSIDSPVPNDNWGYECPCCGSREIDYPEHHCKCGQALNWEEIQE